MSLPSAINATCTSAKSQHSPLRTLRTHSRLCCWAWAREGDCRELPLHPWSLEESQASAGTASPQFMGHGTLHPVPAVASITMETSKSSVQRDEDRFSQALELGARGPCPSFTPWDLGPDLHQLARPSDVPSDQWCSPSRPSAVLPGIWFAASPVPAHGGLL